MSVREGSYILVQSGTGSSVNIVITGDIVLDIPMEGGRGINVQTRLRSEVLTLKKILDLNNRKAKSIIPLSLIGLFLIHYPLSLIPYPLTLNP